MSDVSEQAKALAADLYPAVERRNRVTAVRSPSGPSTPGGCSGTR